MSGRNDGDVVFTLKEAPAGGTAALVDTADNSGQAAHRTGVDVLGEPLTLADPGLFQRISKRLELGYQLSMRDVDGTVLANVFEFLGVEFFIVVVSCGLVEIFLSVFPVPGVATKFSPVVESGLRPSDPGVVVQAATATENLASGVWLLDTGVFGTVDHGSLVAPVVGTTAKIKGTSWCCDFGNFGRVAGSNEDIVQ